MAIYAEDIIAEQQYEIERQHNEVIELNALLSNVLEERNELGKVVDAQGLDLKDASRQLDRLYETITAAILDLAVLGEVPLGDLEEAIEAISRRLVNK